LDTETNQDLNNYYMMPIRDRRERGYLTIYTHERIGKFGMKETCFSEWEHIKGWTNITRKQIDETKSRKAKRNK